MKNINENTKVTLSIGQLKRLIKESSAETQEKRISVPLGLKHMPETLGVLDSLMGQISDGKWENTPSMDKYWIDVKFNNEGGQLVMTFPRYYKDNKYDFRGRMTGVQVLRHGFYDQKFKVNPYEDDGQVKAKEIKAWLANHIKIVAKDEFGSAGWKRDSERESDYLSQDWKNKVTIAQIYAIYDILKERPSNGKSTYYNEFKF